MAWANLVRSTRAVSSGSKICSKQSGNAKRAAINYKVMCSSLQTETPPMRVRTFSGLHGGVNSLCNMVNNRSRHDFHSTVASATSEKASPILPMGEGMFETFTDKAKEVIKFAQLETRPFGYKYVGTEMILLGLIGDGVGKYLGESTDIAEQVLCSMKMRLDVAREIVKEIFGCDGPPSLSVSVEIPFRPNALRAFERALAEAQQLGHNYIGSEHLLLALIDDDDANLVFKRLAVCPKVIHLLVAKMIRARDVGDGSSGNQTPTVEEYVELADEKESHPFVQGNNKTLILEDGDDKELGFNLTELARKKEWWPVVERKPLINTLIQILGRRSKNNAFLVGEKGVGKASVLQGLVQGIRDLCVPDFLSKKEVISVSWHAIAQNRLQNLMEQIKNRNDIIIFIDDEICDLSVGKIESFSDIMMPALVRGGVQCVISATPVAYLHMTKYPKFKKLFQPIQVPSPTVHETIEILEGVQDKLEMTHVVRYTDEAIVAVVHMSDQFLRHGFHPVTALDLMNFAGAFVYKKELHQLRDLLEVGHKMSISTIKTSIKSMPPTVTKADIEDVTLEVLHLDVAINQVFCFEKSYHEVYELLADV